MKLWRWLSLPVVVWALVAWRSGTALAQDGSVSILSDILVKVFVIIDGVLSPFVSGNVLTDPEGQALVASLATIIHNVADFLAQFSILLPASAAG